MRFAVRAVLFDLRPNHSTVFRGAPIRALAEPATTKKGIVMRCRYFCLLFITIMLSATVLHATVVRRTIYLDGGVPVTVDDATGGWPDVDVHNLVLAADRSTVDDCVYTMPDIKGHFNTGDRIFINQNYIAWFDYTIGDGNAPGGVWSRSGELAGYWSLDPTYHVFRYYRMGPNGCWNWPANELITGSAASPAGQTYWWDVNSPAVEHSLGVDTVAAPPQKLYYSFHYAQRSPNAQFQQLVDGVELPDGVHYKQSGLMAREDAGKGPNGIVTDVYDGDDWNLSGYNVYAEVEWICGPTSLRSVFKFKPSHDVMKNNINTFMWAAYSQDEDDTPCDFGGPGDQWPSDAYVTKRPNWAQFSQRTNDNFSASPVGTYTPHPPLEYVHLSLGPACQGVNNWDVFIQDPPQSESWLRFGASVMHDSSEPQWRYTLKAPGNNFGTKNDPINIRLNGCLVGNEVRDGTIVAGCFGLYDDFTIHANTWYQMVVEFSTTT
jgi:hypothetical protein